MIAYKEDQNTILPVLGLFSKFSNKIKASSERIKVKSLSSLIIFLFFVFVTVDDFSILQLKVSKKFLLKIISY